VVDDHQVVREGLANFLALDQELEIAGMAETGEEAVALAQQLKPDVILMDLMMPGTGGLSATATIHQALPATKILVLTSALDNLNINQALKAGASGYLLKNTRAKELCQAIKAVANNQIQLSPEAAALLIQPAKTLPAEALPELSEREQQVLELLAQGLSNKEVAQRLGMAENTVKTHVSAIFVKLGVQSRTQAIHTAIRLGLVAPPR
jgi:DNA-binding NarL/FixJ family response regulator